MRATLPMICLVLIGCFKVGPPSGTIKCDPSNQARPCPHGYSCITGYCWRAGEGPDMSNAIDLGSDMAIGNHSAHVEATSGSGVASVPSSHSVTLTVGEPVTTTASGTNHTVQFGVLRGTAAK